MSRPLAIRSVGDRHGHWTVVRILEPRRSADGAFEPMYEVRAACSGWQKAIAHHNLVHNHAETCVRCVPRRVRKPRKPRPAVPHSHRGNFSDLHRCQVQMPSGMGKPHICGALHRPQDFREHLADEHKLWPPDPAKAFGPTVGEGQSRGVEETEEPDETWIVTGGRP